jgi:hypothetical protein
MREHLSSLPSMDEEEARHHEVVPAKGRVCLRPSRAMGMASAASMHSRRPDSAYRLRDADCVRLKTSLYPEIDFFEDS